MGFDKTELLEKKKQLVSALKDILPKIELVDEQLEDYTQYLGDEEKELQLENWEEKQEDLFELKDSIEQWIKKSKSIK